MHIAVLWEGAGVTIEARTAARVMLLSDAPIDGERCLRWNFVSSSRALIEAAKAGGQARRSASMTEETEWIPLPEQTFMLAADACPGQIVSACDPDRLCTHRRDAGHAVVAAVAVRRMDAGSSGRRFC